jgi:5-formyltetrahydrofolate cyclo-ligase
MHERGSHTVRDDAKRALRRRLLAARRELPAAALDLAGRELRARVLDLPEISALGRTEGRRARVAAYLSAGTEPPTGPLLDALTGSGHEVVLPVLLDDDDLDWATYDGRTTLRAGRRGTTEPAGPPLGDAALDAVEVMIVPGLAVGTDGTRLGRGGGSYDRALARLSPGTPVILLLHDGEVLDQVPSEPHDRTVHVAVTPSGVRRFTPPG